MSAAYPRRRTESAERGLFNLDIANLDGLIERGDRVMARRGRILMRNETAVVQVGDGLDDEAVVQLLSFVDVVASRIAASVLC